ncbi:MAG: 16S rRNA (uracil(1498)-N(3))-methyltransferase [Gammaproteobacteria bacterium]
MRTVRIHIPSPLASGAACTLPSEAGDHVARVLRLKAGATLNVFDGQGGEHAAVIETVRGGEVSVRLGERLDPARESPLSVTLAQGLSRGGRMDYAIQKAVELGVGAIQPLATQRSVVRLDERKAKNRLAHWQHVAISACEQSGRNFVPEVSALRDLNEWLGELDAEAGPRFVLDPGARIGLASRPPPTAQDVTMLVGPEGGLCDSELALTEQHGFVRVRLGPRVLRTETAAVAALTALQTLWGDLAS